MEQATKEAQLALVRAVDDMARFYDIHRHTAPQYNIGDKVWLSSENIKTARPLKKLDYKWLRPYAIDWVISQNAYWLKLPLSFGQVHPVFSVTLLCPYEPNLIPEREKRHPPPPLPVVRDGVEEYEVEKILDSWLFRGRIEYLVSWKGYGVEEDEWRPVQDVQGSKRLIASFHHDHPEAL